ncbi:transposase, IS110 family protein, partial [Salinisphaera sp. PC39]
KQGDAEYRRLLHNAARAAARSDLRPYYERLRARGFKPTQAHVAVTRKLVRIAYSLIKYDQTYDASRVKAA